MINLESETLHFPIHLSGTQIGKLEELLSPKHKYSRNKKTLVLGKSHHLSFNSSSAI